MRWIKIFLVVLFLLFGFTTVFSTPGRTSYENFLYSIKAKTDSFFQVSPGTQIILIEINSAFPQDPNEILFYRQNAWYIQKYVLYISYILTWVGLIYFAKNIKSKLSTLSVSLAFILSFPLLQSVSLTFFEIIAIPIFLLSLILHFKRKNFLWLIAFLLSFLLNWQLIILLPIFIIQIKAKKYDLRLFLNKSLLYFGVFSLLTLFPYYSSGQLIWLVIFSLLNYIVNPSEIEKYKLFLINFIVFMLFYRFFGFYGQPPVRDIYFQVFRYLFSVFFIFYQIWNIRMIRKEGFKLNTLKIFTIAFSILVLLAHITAVGDPDVDNWVKYTKAVVQYVNPFYAHTQVVQLYAPLSTVIMGGFAQVWHYIIGPSKDYAIATKLGILAFLYFTINLLSKYSNKKIKTIDKYLTIFTTFILINQTLGYGDINIYLIPFILLSMVFIYRSNFFLSGFFLALAISIKWQPVILLPLFAVAVFNFRDGLLKSFKNSLLFLLGLIPVVVGFWALVIIQPEGLRVFQTAYELYTKGGVYLSGLALNLNWIITYIYPALYPEKVGFWMGIGRQATAFNAKLAPAIFSGYLFYAVGIIIVIRYWFLEKKNLLAFTAAVIMVFYSHYALNVSAMNLHFFYQTVFMLFLYLLNPSKENRMLLILFDALAMVSNILFYGFTGEAVLNRMIFGFDITVAFAVFYMIVYFWISFQYFKGGLLLKPEKK